MQQQKYNQGIEFNSPDNIIYIQETNDSSFLTSIKNSPFNITKQLDGLNNSIYQEKKNHIFFTSTQIKIREIFQDTLKLKELQITSIPKRYFVTTHIVYNIALI
jgi:hypothetical protein